jgi:TonB family protein
VYPPLAKTAGITGTVVRHAIIAQDRSVSQLEYVSRPPLLLNANLDAVSQWGHKPTLLHSQPVEMDTTIYCLGRDNSSGAAGQPPPPEGQTAPPPLASGTLLSEIPAATRPFPDSVEGMKLQMAGVLRTWWAGDKDKFAVELDGFAIPDSKAWLNQSFGEQRGAALVTDYGKSLDAFKSHIWWICGHWCNAPDLMLKVESSELPRPPEQAGAEAELPRPTVPLEVENFMFTLSMGPRIAERSVFSFVYLDGAFRIVGGTYPFWNEDLQRQRRSLDVNTGALGPNGRIFTGGTVQAAKLIHLVQPEYPREAKRMLIQGTVHLHAIIGKDGRVSELRVIDGDPDLAHAAMNAVRRWRYKPTLLEGNPVEVDTTISVVFTLGSN